MKRDFSPGFVDCSGLLPARPGLVWRSLDCQMPRILGFQGNGGREFRVRLSAEVEEARGVGLSSRWMAGGTLQGREVDK